MFTNKKKAWSAGVYRRQGAILIDPHERTVYGVYIGGSPIVCLREEVSDVVLGTALLDALERGKAEVPHPSDWKRVAEPLLEAAGVKTWRAFMKGSLYCSASRNERQIRLIPSHNGGKAFEHLVEKTVAISSYSLPATIGAAIREALARSD